MENVVPLKRASVSLVSDSGDETKPHSMQRQPLLSDGKLAHANAEATLYELEQVIAVLVKESDGGSKTIPRFRKILSDLRANLAKLKP